MSHKKADDRPFFKEFDALSGNQIQARDAILLVEIWTQHKERVRRNDGWRFKESLDACLKKAANASFSREEAVKLIEFLFAEEGPHLHYFESAAFPFVQAWLSKCPDDPLFQLYRVRLQAEPNPEETLNKIIAEATRRKDDRTAQMARRHLNSFFAPPPPFPMPGKDMMMTFWMVATKRIRRGRTWSKSWWIGNSRTCPRVTGSNWPCS